MHMLSPWFARAMLGIGASTHDLQNIKKTSPAAIDPMLPRRVCKAESRLGTWVWSTICGGVQRRLTRVLCSPSWSLCQPSNSHVPTIANRRLCSPRRPFFHSANMEAALTVP
jgi:hypothetical protein